VVSPRTDPSSTLSLRAVERAFEWYAEEVKLAEKPPISAAQADALCRALRGERTLGLGELELLVRLARTLFLVGKRAPELPTFNLGDALTALAALGTNASERWSWRYDPSPSQETFEKLGFGKTSAGIIQTQRENRKGWDVHAQLNRRFILDAARGCERRELAVVLGAGQGFDLPLAELAQAFERVVLVDIDGEALEKTVETSFTDPALRARVEMRVLDLTGINGQLVRAVDDIFAAQGRKEAIDAELAALCRSYWLAEIPSILPADYRADLLVSGLVLSQVSWPQRSYALRLYEERFGKLTPEAERRWISPWWEFELKIQQEHISSLGTAAERVVLCSDVISRTMGRNVFALGVTQLEERVPQSLLVEQHAAWEWARYPGCVMDVEGLRLKPRFR